MIISIYGNEPDFENPYESGIGIVVKTLTEMQEVIGFIGKYKLYATIDCTDGIEGFE